MVHKGKHVYKRKNKPEKPKAPKKARIIVRNLPFKNLSEESVEEFFREYGDIEEVKLLKKDNGTFVGCGFVQFKKVTSAAKAIVHANEKEMLGRKIVLDWALPKNTFVKKIKKLENDFKKDNIKQENSAEDEKDNLNFVIDRKPNAWDNDDGNSEGGSEESGDNDSEKNIGGGGSDDDDDDEDGGDGDDIENEVDGEKNKKVCHKKSDKQQKNQNLGSKDVEEGKTVFVRNIPFSATNEDLRSCVENYGAVEYALICIDKLTEHSKGTGFVKFREKESALKCIKDSNKIFLHDNALTITVALSKQSLEIKKTSKKVVKDSRNLYLIREGVVVAGSKAAEGVSAGDMAKRLQLEQWKNQILKNLNMFVSRTRLVIHNLPSSYDDSKLRTLFAKYSSPKAVIKEAKVMYDKKKLNAAGKSISKEVGFVSFTDHEDALVALRNINNNPTIFGAKKRPIVAFSIENKAAINSKIKRMEKSRAKLGVSCDVSGKPSKLNRKQRRFLKRREKFIEMRKEKKVKAKEVVEEDRAEKSGLLKRKRMSSNEEEPRRKRKTGDSVGDRGEVAKNAFIGVISESGKKIKLRSKFRLKTQANIHSQTLKKERQKRRENEKKKMGRIKLPKEKKGRPKLIDDANLSKLLKKHRESVQASSQLKKWYDK